MWRLSVCVCGLFYLTVVADTATEGHRHEQVQYIREWTPWFNTDRPDTGTGDDESLASIRKRGHTVCYDSTPIDAFCRNASDHSAAFHVGSTDFTEDVLVIPCTSLGIVCRNSEQSENRTCADYEIRFQCLSISEQAAEMGNLGLIGVAAGLSVIVPILCVTCMHVTKIIKDRSRRHNRRHDEEDALDGESSSDSGSSGDLPPSYSDLFGDNGGSLEQLLSTSPPGSSVIGENSDTHNSRRNSITSISSQVERSGNSSRLSRSASFRVSGSDAQNEAIQTPPPPRRAFRLPGMHLSIIDLILSRGGGEEPDSPGSRSQDSQSYIQTPPPTYKEAILIIGGKPLKSTDLVEPHPTGTEELAK